MPRRTRGWVAAACVAACLLAAATASAAPLTGTASMVTAIPSTGASSDPFGMTAFNGALYFGAMDPGHGRELWRSDGTAAGTALLADLVPGAPGSDAGSFAVAGGKLFFLGDGGIWVTDGTAGGAQKLATVNVQSTNSTPALVASGSHVFFDGSDTTHGQELWVSDGTVAGTKLISDLCPGTCGQPTWIVPYNGGVMFAGNGGPSIGIELYFSDGTSDTLVKDIVSGPTSSGPHDLAVLGTKVYFGAYDGTNTKLLMSDGTAGNATAVGATPTDPEGLVVTSTGRMFFAATDAANGHELWSMTSSTSPALVSNISPGGSSSDIDSLSVAGSKAYFRITNPTPTFWASDGSTTTRLLDLPTSNSSVGSPVELGGQAFFMAASTATGSELFRTNGTAVGTAVLKDVNPGAASSAPVRLELFAGALYFGADDGLHGRELWRSDGTEAGTTMLKDINGSDAGVFPFSLAPFGGGAIFSARSLAGGYEPWRSDGTAAGTTALGELRPGFQPVDYGAAPAEYTPIAGAAMVFAGNDIDHGRELWRVGSGGDVSLVKDIVAGTGDSAPSYFSAAGGLVYFLAQNASGHYALWRTDGTAGGTLQLDDLGGSDTSGYSVNPLAVGNELVYRRSDTGDLWKTDGTPAGTVKLVTGPTDEHAVSGTTIWYVANHTLWKTSTTPGSATEVAPLPATSSLDGAIIARPDGAFFALGTYDVNHYDYALWHSDGTVAGTHALTDLATDGQRFDWQLTWAAGLLYFDADDTVHGFKTWVSDGTVAGTRLLFDDAPGKDFGGGSIFTEHLGHVFFEAYDQAGQYYALWQTDGTTAGTVKASDAHLDGDEPMLSLGDTLYFSGGDNVHGQQLWTWKLAPPLSPAALPVITRLSLSPRSFLAATKGASAVAAKAKPKPKAKPGTIVSYQVSAAASVRFTVSRLVKGRRAGKRCVKATTRNRKAKACTRVVVVRGSFSRVRQAGPDRFRFTGRMGGKRLAPGRYRLTATPSAGAKSGKGVTTSFTIRRRR